MSKTNDDLYEKIEELENEIKDLKPYIYSKFDLAFTGVLVMFIITWVALYLK
jgi:hypothetical protein